MSGWVPLAIGVVAPRHASVGHAGATGDIAVMTLADLPPEVIRPTALVLNVCVATIARADQGPRTESTAATTTIPITTKSPIRSPTP